MSVKFVILRNCDLHLDEVYEGGKQGNAGDDVISKIFKTYVAGGFRTSGSSKPFRINYCILYSDLKNTDWPDSIDIYNGMFIYFGDNKSPGDILKTKHKGNLILEESFKLELKKERKNIPPFFIFTKESGQNRKFRGLAVPGHPRINIADSLVAQWNIKDGKRYQNYKAIFSILSVNEIKRNWIENLLKDRTSIIDAPKEWVNWVQNKKYKILEVPSKKLIRTKAEQLPSNSSDEKILKVIYDHFNKNKKGAEQFEYFSGEIIKLMDQNIGEIDITRFTRDGGRDGIGYYDIGKDKSRSLKIDFAIEAKRYNLNSGVGIKDTKRLISRLRHRQFGILISTSYVSKQAYEEIVADAHPILIISGIDLVLIVKDKIARTPKDLSEYLKKEYPYE